MKYGPLASIPCTRAANLCPSSCTSRMARRAALKVRPSSQGLGQYPARSTAWGTSRRTCANRCEAKNPVANVVPRVAKNSATTSHWWCALRGGRGTNCSHA